MKYTVRGLEVKVSGECLRDKINGDMNFSVEELHLEGNFEEIMTTAFELFNEIANVTKPEVKDEIKECIENVNEGKIEKLWNAFINNEFITVINGNSVMFADSVVFDKDILEDREVTKITCGESFVIVPAFYRNHQVLSKERFVERVKEFVDII